MSKATVISPENQALTTYFWNEFDKIFSNPDHDDFGMCLLWNETAYPCAGFDKEAVELYLGQLKKFKQAIDEGKIVCMFCGEIKPRSGYDLLIDDCCKECQDKLDKENGKVRKVITTTPKLDEMEKK